MRIKVKSLMSLLSVIDKVKYIEPIYIFFKHNIMLNFTR